MKNNAFIYGVIGIIVGAILVWSTMFSIINSNNFSMMQMMGIGNPSSGRSEKLDAHFIEQMIPHHEDAIIMAKLALTKARHEEIKILAQNISDSQNSEINQMKVWYKEWYGREVPEGDDVMSGHGMMEKSSLHMGMMGNDTDMSRLETANDFDTAFIEEMIPHHQMAVMMAQMLKNGTSRPEMKQLADDIIDAQSTEIDQMREWYREWK